MKDYTYFTEENLLPSRLDILSAKLSNFSRSKIKKLILAGNILVNKEIAKDPALIISDYCEIIIKDEPEAKKSELSALKLELDIIYEDEYLLVINKPAGLTVHPGAGNYNDTLVNGLIYYYKNLPDNAGSDRPGIVHRLDRDTTGLMVIAKTSEAHSSLAKQIEERIAKRSYLALCWGLFLQSIGEVKTNIGRSPQNRERMAVLVKGGKYAVTHYKVMEIFKGGLCSLVECILETGRTHQIRVHMSHIGHSIIGDQTYGSNDRKAKQIQNAELREIILGFNRQALHAYRLSFHHPISGKEMSFEVDMPKDMKYLIDIMK